MRTNPNREWPGRNRARPAHRRPRLTLVTERDHVERAGDRPEPATRFTVVPTPDVLADVIDVLVAADISAARKPARAPDSSRGVGTGHRAEEVRVSRGSIDDLRPSPRGLLR
jgi:hypothetical protein